MPSSLLNKGERLSPCHDGCCQVGYVRQWWQEEQDQWHGGHSVGKRMV